MCRYPSAKRSSRRGLGLTVPMSPNADEASEAFAREAGSHGPISVAGRRTRWALGGPLERGARVIRAPQGIVEVSPAEMTVRVRAGTLVCDLRDELSRFGQRSALPERGGTVGGAVAVAENHPDVLGRGAVRDSVLQVRYVSAEGKLITCGGPVVKNVSGYSLHRLITGSLGTLGLISEVVLRTNPIPEVSRWFVAADSDPVELAEKLYRPACILFDGARTWLNLEGHGVDVESQLRVAEKSASFLPVDGPPDFPAHHWSMTPREAATFGDRGIKDFVASIGVGSVWTTHLPPPFERDPSIRTLAARVKAEFDPDGRLNPGRRP